MTLAGPVHAPGPDRPLTSTVTVVEHGNASDLSNGQPASAVDLAVAPVSATNTVQEWLDHPVGGGLLRAALGGPQFDEDAIAPAFGLSLEQLVAMSGGRFSQATLDDLIARVNSPRLV
jgi:hypothetical protein